jgi:hypothetical protein
VLSLFRASFNPGSKERNATKTTATPAEPKHELRDRIPVQGANGRVSALLRA